MTVLLAGGARYIASPYGWTKDMIEQIITDCAAETPDFLAVIFRYFNPVGARPSGLIGEAPNGAPNNLMPYITQVAMEKRKQLSFFGADYDTPDGTWDYIHIMDIATTLPFCASHSGESSQSWNGHVYKTVVRKAAKHFAAKEEGLYAAFPSSETLRESLVVASHLAADSLCSRP